MGKGYYRELTDILKTEAGAIYLKNAKNAREKWQTKDGQTLIIVFPLLSEASKVDKNAIKQVDIVFPFFNKKAKYYIPRPCISPHTANNIMRDAGLTKRF